MTGETCSAGKRLRVVAAFGRLYALKDLLSTWCLYVKAQGALYQPEFAEQSIHSSIMVSTLVTTSPRRRTAEELLQQVQAEEAYERWGKLEVFLGYASGGLEPMGAVPTGPRLSSHTDYRA